MAALKVGETAPDFELPAVTGKQRHKFQLSDYRGKKNVVLAFYPLDWSPTCTSQMTGYKTFWGQFSEQNTEVVGISTDSIYSHLAWQEKSIGWQDFPLASDYWPHGAIAEKYGILREGEPIPGINERAVFIVDREGKIAFSKVYELGQEPDNKECLEVLRKLG